MKLVEFIALDSILVDVDVDSKKNLFKLVSNFFAKNDLEDSSKIVEKLNERERLGSTGVGNGIAIPHSKISLIDKTKVLFLKLKSAVDFSAPDKKYVDLVFVILAPKNCQSEHLLVLSSIASFVKNESFVKKTKKIKEPKRNL
jgi:PTS system nitrogen regulatory IIA component